jgi:hypothetical protein
MGQRSMWYLAYRRDGSIRMRVFKTRDLALRAACEMFGDREDDDLEVGPMLAPRDGNVFKGDALRRVRQRRRLTRVLARVLIRVRRAVAAWNRSADPLFATAGEYVRVAT